MTRDLSAKFAPFGIRVNALSPGSFDTDLVAAFKNDPESFAGYLSSIPMARLGNEGDVKGAAVSQKMTSERASVWRGKCEAF